MSSLGGGGEVQFWVGCIFMFLGFYKLSRRVIFHFGGHLYGFGDVRALRVVFSFAGASPPSQRVRFFVGEGSGATFYHSIWFYRRCTNRKGSFAGVLHLTSHILSYHDVWCRGDLIEHIKGCFFCSAASFHRFFRGICFHLRPSHHVGRRRVKATHLDH